MNKSKGGILLFLVVTTDIYAKQKATFSFSYKWIWLFYSRPITKLIRLIREIKHWCLVWSTISVKTLSDDVMTFRCSCLWLCRTQCRVKNISQKWNNRRIMNIEKGFLFRCAVPTDCSARRHFASVTLILFVYITLFCFEKGQRALSHYLGTLKVR